MVEETPVRWKVYYSAAIPLQHGLDPIGFVEPHVVLYENTFMYSTGQEILKAVYEVFTKLFFIELMILYLEEFQVTSIPEIRTDLFNLIESGSIEVTPSDCDGHQRKMLKYNRCYFVEEINE
ncbi:hypothetical protein RF11_01734 [Thelohanellus kitauei]|uniref:Uncharacterized protein n=1 Tax=Thelohanellus kitauei TaxID=669202 RepID=A0A0C2MMA5_THEKT|nr:hypothetical protein RF11_01734 [Thelohanellus kitauei]